MAGDELRGVFKRLAGFVGMLELMLGQGEDGPIHGLGSFLGDKGVGAGWILLKVSGDRWSCGRVAALVQDNEGRRIRKKRTDTSFPREGPSFEPGPSRRFGLDRTGTPAA